MTSDQELNGSGANAVYRTPAAIATVDTSGGRRIAVRGIELAPDDIRQRHREKIARITVDSMVQFVALLDAGGTVVDINQVTLDAAGMTLSEVEGKPFWTTYWWQVSSEINAQLRDRIARAAKAEFARWETEIYERPGRRDTIVIEASLTPVVDDQGRVAFICAEGRDITRTNALEGAIGQKNIELRALHERIREFDDIKTRCLANIGHELRTPLTLILGPAQRLIDAGTLAPDERRETGQVIMRNARILLKHVDDLLNSAQLANMGHGDGALRHPESSRLAGVVEELRSAAPKRRAKDAASDAEPKPVVLVVEDNPDMNRFMAQCLSSTCDVICAFDGRDGLEKAIQFRPALIVSDITMPVMSGVEMIAEIRKRPELTMPVLLLSATADEDLVVKLLDQGAQDFILKPFSEKDLLVRVRSLIAAGQVRAAAIHSLAREHAAREAAERQKHLIDKLRVAAESANRAKDEFLAILGHELRNPLSPIVTALQLMKLQGADEKTERARTVIERQVNHLIRLVDDLLDVSRIARGKVELKCELVDMADIVGKAIEMASPILEQRTHALRVDVPRNVLHVDGDPVRLFQVVSNLLTNAAKYTPPGGQISISAQQLDGEVVLHVRDSGIGIPPDVLPNIFDLFVQERQAIDRSQGGLGLGLTIVRNLVERHGGSVSAHSDGVGRGSEFIVRLPKAGPSRAETTADAVPAATGATRTCGPGIPRILVVDDNEDAAQMLAVALEQRGYPTRVAHDAPTALRLAAEFSPEIAFLDLGLPVMDGYELAAHLRALPALAGLRLIALTGYGQDSDRQRTRQAGFHDHLVKPVGIDDIEAALTASG